MSALIMFVTQTQQGMVLPHMRAHVNMPAKEEAKQNWLSRIEDAHTWKKGVISPVGREDRTDPQIIECEEATTATADAQRLSEAAAKKKWLDAVDSTPTWRTTAATAVAPAPPPLSGYDAYMASRGHHAPDANPAAAPVAAAPATPVAAQLATVSRPHVPSPQEEARTDAALPPLLPGAAVMISAVDDWAAGRTGIVRNYDVACDRYYVWLPHEPKGLEGTRDRPILKSLRRAHLDLL